MPSTDEELVARSQGGDLDSFNQLVLRWERPIYALAYRVIGREEDARDVAQETFLRAFRALKGFKGQAKFSSCAAMVVNEMIRNGSTAIAGIAVIIAGIPVYFLFKPARITHH